MLILRKICFQNINIKSANLMKKIFLVTSLFSMSYMTYAQTGTTRLATSSLTTRTTATSTTSSTTNQSEFNNTNSIIGWFEVPASTPGAHYSVGYTFYTKPFRNELKVSMGIGTPNSYVSLTGKIVNATGSEMITWSSGNFGGAYNHTFDISSLSPGMYHFDIYDANNNKVSSIPFEKSAN
jgi:hypothetical protein